MFSLASWLNKPQDKTIKLGILGVVLAFVAVAGIFALSVPWRGSNDEPLHIDYAWKVSHGQLPKFYEGTNTPYFTHLPIQSASQHPPLYYVLTAPTTRVFIDQGNWQAAVLAARLISLFIGVLCILSLAWAGWVLGGKHRSIMSVAVPLIGASLTPFIKVSGNAMNDNLLVLTATLALIISALIIKNGLSKKYLLWLSVVSIAGMSSRATFISVLAVSLLSIAISAYLQNPKRLRIAFKKASLWILTVLVAVFLTIGWFYIRNHRASGSWYRSGPQSWVADVQGRNYRSLGRVLTKSNLWVLVPSQLYGYEWKKVLPIARKPINYWLSSLVFGSLGIVFLVWAYKKRPKHKNIKNLALPIVFGLLVALTFAEQIVHATGYGATSIKYFLPLLLIISLIMAIGALMTEKKYGLVLILTAVIGWLASLANTSWFIVSRYGDNSKSVMTNIKDIIVAQNHVPFVLIILLLVLLMAGIILQSWAILRLVQANRTALNK